jgi:tetratricopeptide (TPR) repeat protein
VAAIGSGFHRGVFLSTVHDRVFVRNSVFLVDPFFCHHFHHPFFSFSFGFGFPFYAYYYSPYPYYGYPYWCDPWYPYYGGIYYYPPPPPYYYNREYYNGDYSQGYVSAQTVPDAQAAPPAESAPVETARGEAGTGSITPIPRNEIVENRPGSATDTVTTVAASAPAKNALEGLAEFRGGDYTQASDSLFQAAQATTESQSLKLYLAESLFAIGEYGYAADYLREALDARPDLASQPFNASRLYSQTPQGEEDFAKHFSQLVEHVRLDPGDNDALMVLGFIQLNSSRPEDAGATLTVLRDSAARPQDQAIAARLMGEAERRAGAVPDGSAPELLEPARLPASDPLGEVLAAALD